MARFDQSLALRAHDLQTLLQRSRTLPDVAKVPGSDRELWACIRGGSYMRRGGVWSSDCFEEIECYEDALRGYDRVLSIDANHIEALIKRGDVRREMGAPEDAIPSYNRALSLQPDCLEAALNRGLAALETIHARASVPLLNDMAASAASYAGFYINLDRSVARREHVEAEINRQRRRISISGFQPSMASAQNIQAR